MSDLKYRERLSLWQRRIFSQPPEPSYTPAEPSMLAMVPMRDGVKLYTEVFLPNSKNSFPVILVRSPYPFSLPSIHDARPIGRYLDAGFAFAFQLTRGQGKSEGTFHHYEDDIIDGVDCIAWLDSQDWCNGKVGMEGSSYLGSTQLLAAREKPKALKCIMPTAFVGHSLKAYPFINGVPMKGAFLFWCKQIDMDSPFDPRLPHGTINQLLDHPTWGPALNKCPLIEAGDDLLEGDKLLCWKEEMSTTTLVEKRKRIEFTDEVLGEINIPTFYTAGLYDMTVGPIDFFSRQESLQPNDPHRYLLIGPWNHSQTYSSFQQKQPNGERVTPENGRVDLVQQRLLFFKKYLKGDKQLSVQNKRVRLYVTGLDQWLDFSTFPIPDTDYLNLYLHSEGEANNFPGDGSLNTDKPCKQPPDTYIYDPGFPTPSEDKPILDRRNIEIRSDVLTYTSATFSTPVIILGEIKLFLYASSDALDTDWFANITEVFPDGKSIAFHYSISAIRARFRNGFEKEALLEPNKTVCYELSLGVAAHQITAGNSVRLSIYSSAFPKFDANKNTGNHPATDTFSQKATQQIYHDGEMPSRLRVPTYTI